MEKIIIPNGNEGDGMATKTVGGDLEINVVKTDSVSDGYHTFGELYDHRITLFVALAKLLRRQENVLGSAPGESFVWRSKRHHAEDQAMYDGWFVLGIGRFEGQQITYHLPLARWDETDFADTLDHAPKWDGHTAADVLDRLKNL